MCHKVEFNSYYEAEKEKRKINWFLCLKKKKKLTKIYKCKECGCYHLTSDTHTNKLHYEKEIVI